MKRLINFVAQFMTKKAPAIFTGLTIAGAFGTAICVAKGTIKVHTAIEGIVKEQSKNFYNEHKEDLENGEDLEFSYNGKVFTERVGSVVTERPFTLKEKAKVCWKFYIPSAIMLGLTIACAIAAHTESEKRLAALYALYAIGEDRAKILEEKITRELPPEKVEAIKKEVTSDLSDRHQILESDDIIEGIGVERVYDGASGRYFWSDMETIRQAENDINSELIHSGGPITLNELYYRLNLSSNKIGGLIGWTDANLLRIRFGSKLMENGRPCLTIDYKCDVLFWEH